MFPALRSSHGKWLPYPNAIAQLPKLILWKIIKAWAIFNTARERAKILMYNASGKAMEVFDGRAPAGVEAVWQYPKHYPRNAMGFKSSPLAIPDI